MESASPRPAPVRWTPPAWLEQSLLPDRLFARAYEALGDARRARLKTVIAAQFALNPPRQTLARETIDQLPSGLTRRTTCIPRPFALLFTDESLDAPALFLAALLPALSSRIAEVLVLRLGGKASVPDALLTACELAGQERVAALGPVQAERLLLQCASSGQPGLVLCPDTENLRRLFSRPRLREALDASPLCVSPLALPRRLGLWRDAPGQFDPEALALLYGPLVFDCGGVKPGSRGRAPADSAFASFAAAPRDLLLIPEARCGAGQGGQVGAARLVSEPHLGLWTWPELTPGVFALTQVALRSAS